MPFLERGVHADSLAAAMTDLEGQSGTHTPLLDATVVTQTTTKTLP